jgi:hypothetical protein
VLAAEVHLDAGCQHQALAARGQRSDTPRTFKHSESNQARASRGRQRCSRTPSDDRDARALRLGDTRRSRNADHTRSTVVRAAGRHCSHRPALFACSDATRRQPDKRPVERSLHSAEACGYHWPATPASCETSWTTCSGLPLGLARTELSLQHDTHLPRAIAEAQASWATVQGSSMRRVLSRAQGNVAQAALVLDRTTVIRKLARTGTSRDT